LIFDAHLFISVTAATELELCHEAVHAEQRIVSAHFFEAGDDTVIPAKVFNFVDHAFLYLVVAALQVLHECERLFALHLLIRVFGKDLGHKLVVVVLASAWLNFELRFLGSFQLLISDFLCLLIISIQISSLVQDLLLVLMQFASPHAEYLRAHIGIVALFRIANECLVIAHHQIVQSFAQLGVNDLRRQ